MIKKVQDQPSDVVLRNPTVPSLISSQSQDFPCTTCKKRFDSKRALTTHQNSHKEKSTELSDSVGSKNPNVSPSPKVTCNICNQSFPRRGLQTHLNRHAKEANDQTANRLKSRLNPNTDELTPVKNDDVKSNRSELDSECNNWQEVFKKHESNENLDTEAFDNDVSKFQKFLFKANQRLPRPQHPSVKFYRLRQQNKNRSITSTQQSRSSNPQQMQERNSEDVINSNLTSLNIGITINEKNRSGYLYFLY